MASTILRCSRAARARHAARTRTSLDSARRFRGDADARSRRRRRASSSVARRADGPPQSAGDSATAFFAQAADGIYHLAAGLRHHHFAGTLVARERRDASPDLVRRVINQVEAPANERAARTSRNAAWIASEDDIDEPETRRSAANTDRIGRADIVRYAVRWRSARAMSSRPAERYRVGRTASTGRRGAKSPSTPRLEASRYVCLCY